MIDAGTLTSKDSRAAFVGEERGLIPRSRLGSAGALGAPVADDRRKALGRRETVATRLPVVRVWPIRLDLACSLRI
jgi:hypothetical protein